ncbi:DNA-binding protein [Halobacterium sp. DL1]|jgi:DNA-binding response OmpR family regulator|nr:DNA-binding protein [Halobacterium sp. DL1]
MTDQEQPVVLIAEDEQTIAEGYELWLSDQYEVRLTADGQEALDAVDDTVDVVLLDRMMPELSGEQVLREIRERAIDCRVAMVTAVEPDFDVVEMGFDAYITKPPERQELLDTIQQLLDRAGVDDAFQQYHSLMARRGALQAQKTEAELEQSEVYQDLLDRIESQRTEVDDNLGNMGAEVDFVSAVREVEDGDSGFDDVELGEGENFEDADTGDFETSEGSDD